MDQPLFSTYVIQPGPVTQPNGHASSLNDIAQSTVAHNTEGKQLQPAVVNTPTLQSSLSTNMVQPVQSSPPSGVVSTPAQISQSGNSNALLYYAYPPGLPHDASERTGLPSSSTGRLVWKWGIIVPLCILILSMIVLLPLALGLGTSKNSAVSHSGIQLAQTRTLPELTPTQLPKAKPTSAPASNLNPTPKPTLIPTSQPSSAPTPVIPTPTTSPPYGPGITTSSLAPSQCSTTNQGWTCTETLSEDQHNSGNLPWSASTGMTGVTFNPISGTLSPGETIQVSIAIPLSDCSDTFTFKGPLDTAQVSWNCTLPAPRQLSPASGTVFNNYPRTTTLQWSTVPGATSYTVQVYYYQPGDTTCTGGAQDYLTPNITNTSYTFDFVGAQPGCWRVWAVDATGRQSPSSGWWEFSYTI